MTVRFGSGVCGALLSGLATMLASAAVLAATTWPLIDRMWLALLVLFGGAALHLLDPLRRRSGLLKFDGNGWQLAGQSGESAYPVELLAPAWVSPVGSVLRYRRMAGGRCHSVFICPLTNGPQSYRQMLAWLRHALPDSGSQPIKHIGAGFLR